MRRAVSPLKIETLSKKILAGSIVQRDLIPVLKGYKHFHYGKQTFKMVGSP
jgi:hypothetical protein